MVLVFELKLQLVLVLVLAWLSEQLVVVPELLRVLVLALALQKPELLVPELELVLSEAVAWELE